jgi:hypothetical protein
MPTVSIKRMMAAMPIRLFVIETPDGNANRSGS